MKHCPCHECAGGLVEYRMHKVHKKEMDEGTRDSHVVVPSNHDGTTPVEDRTEVIEIVSTSNHAASQRKPERTSTSNPAASRKKRKRTRHVRVIAPSITEFTDKKFAVELTELVSQNAVNQTGANAVCKIIKGTYGPALQEQGFLPATSWYMLRKATVSDGEAKSFTRDFCSDCGELFPVDVKVVRCSSCERINTRFDKQGKALVQAVYFDLDNRVERMFNSPFLAQETQVGKKRPRAAEKMSDRELTDVWDGSILEELYHNYSGPDHQHKDNFLYFGNCQDGVELSKRVTYTPCTTKLLNWGKDLRGLLGSIWLLAYFPPKVQNYQAMLRPLVEMFARHQPGKPPLLITREGFPVLKIWYMVAFNMADIRGLPTTTCGSSPPCFVGGCNWCHQPGIRVHGRTIMPGAVCGCDVDSELRGEWAAEFQTFVANEKDHGHGYCTDFELSGPPAKRTCLEAKESADRVLEALSQSKKPGTGAHKKAKQENAFFDHDVYSELLLYHDKISHTLFDPAHEISNLIKQIFFFMGGRTKEGKLLFNQKMREGEIRLDRFPRLEAGEYPDGKKKWPKPSWIMPNNLRDKADQVSLACKVPTGWPKMRKWFTDGARVKCSEWILLAGDAGVYILSNIMAEVRSKHSQPVDALWIELLRICQKVRRKVSTPGDREIIQERLPVIMTQLEMALPLSWSTTVVHIFTFHILHLLEAAGPYCVANMMDYERYHTLFKKFARGRMNLMQSIREHHTLWLACQDQRNQQVQLKWEKTPLRSTPAGFQSRPKSKNRLDRFVSTKGSIEKKYTLLDHELVQIELLWATVDEEYGAFHARFVLFNDRLPANARLSSIKDWQGTRRNPTTPREQLWQKMNREVVMYKRAEYAGNHFCTEKYQTEKKVKYDNTHVREDYLAQDSQGVEETLTRFGTIKNIFVHQAFPNGPAKVVLCCRWFETITQSDAITGLAVVQEKRNLPENTKDKFTFLETVYQVPVAVWKYMPFKEFKGNDERRTYFNIIDRNQDQLAYNPVDDSDAETADKADADDDVDDADSDDDADEADSNDDADEADSESSEEVINMSVPSEEVINMSVPAWGYYR